MFGKLLLVILTALLTAAALLVTRQQRLETAHRASVIHRRLAEQERSLWELQSRIAAACRPESIRSAMERLDQAWEPIPAEPPPAADPKVRVVDAAGAESGAGGL
ncbi:MAG: hypothetical protein ACYTJ0_13585 [Planctomycetota bacterium]|jgi:hypothetical protein